MELPATKLSTGHKDRSVMVEKLAIQKNIVKKFSGKCNQILVV